MPTTPIASIALLIEADNAPSSKIDFIISELASHGVVNIRRAYGNWKKAGLAGWEKVLHGYRKLSDLFSAIDLFEVKTSKNGDQTIFHVRLKKGSAKINATPKA